MKACIFRSLPLYDAVQFTASWGTCVKLGTVGLREPKHRHRSRVPG
jgi:hypothetical protein